MSFDPLRSQRYGSSINSNSQVMTRKANGFHAAFVSFSQSGEFEQANIFKRNGISGSAAVNYQLFVTSLLFKKGYYFFFLFSVGHTKRNVYFTIKMVANTGQQFLIEIAGRRNFDNGGIERNNFFGRSNIPHRAGILHTELITPALEQAVLFEREFKVFAMLTVGSSVGIIGIWMRCIEFLLGEQFMIVSFLKLHHIHMTKCSCSFNHFERYIHFTLVITTNFGYYFWFFHYKSLLLLHFCGKRQNFCNINLMILIERKHFHPIHFKFSGRWFFFCRKE